MDENELPSFEDLVAHLRSRGTQVHPKSGRWTFRVRGSAGDRLVAIEHEGDPDSDGWIYVRVARGETFVDPEPIPGENEPKLDLGIVGLFAYAMSGEVQSMIPFEMINSLADFDRVLDRLLEHSPP